MQVMQPISRIFKKNNRSDSNKNRCIWQMLLSRVAEHFNHVTHVGECSIRSLAKGLTLLVLVLCGMHSPSVLRGAVLPILMTYLKLQFEASV